MKQIEEKNGEKMDVLTDFQFFFQADDRPFYDGGRRRGQGKVGELRRIFLSFPLG